MYDEAVVQYFLEHQMQLFKENVAESPEEAEEALRIGENAIYKLLNEGKLKAYKNGRTWRVPKEAVKEYVIALSKITQSCS